MAKPRVFISSTYFDLKAVRADLEHFVREMGFDPVLHERGSIPYSRHESLQNNCYREVENCDILVSIVGGRFGSISEESDYSVSQTELKAALDQNKQVYIFVQREVYHEYSTYEKNSEKEIDWTSVDSKKIFEFLSELYKLKNNNPIISFETSHDITNNLKHQWSGLFQRLLSESSLLAQHNMFLQIKEAVANTRSLLEIASENSTNNRDAVDDIILTSHPLFSYLTKILNVQYRVFFTSKSELDKWLSARSYREDEVTATDGFFEWDNVNLKTKIRKTVKVSKALFDEDENLIPFTKIVWSEDLVESITVKITQSAAFDDDDDDVPF